MSTILTALLAIVLTSLLVLQLGAFATVLRSRRVLASRRTSRPTDLLWAAIPVAVVLFLAARTWFVAFDLDPGSVAMVTLALSARVPAPGSLVGFGAGTVAGLLGFAAVIGLVARGFARRGMTAYQTALGTGSFAAVGIGLYWLVA